MTDSIEGDATVTVMDDAPSTTRTTTAGTDPEGEASNKNATPPLPHPRVPKIAMIVPRGSKLRDEFVCPITREFVADPVIAADGHTYDRLAIEQWLRGPSTRRSSGSSSPNNFRRTSPKTGEPLAHMHLIPNHNLKRLLQDMLKEGGEGLFCPEDGHSLRPPISRPSTPSTTEEDETSTSPGRDTRVEEDTSGNGDPEPVVAVTSGPRLALVRELIFKARCLGPPESDWNGRSFSLSESYGSANKLSGGRRRPHDPAPHSEIVQFTDATVSRRHFEIQFSSGGKFQIRDLGSAGGTFVRIPPRRGVVLRAGMMVMLGKHQLLAVEPQEGAELVPGRRDLEIGISDKVSVGVDFARTPRYGDEENQGTNEEEGRTTGRAFQRQNTVPFSHAEELYSDDNTSVNSDHQDNENHRKQHDVPHFTTPTTLNRSSVHREVSDDENSVVLTDDNSKEGEANSSNLAESTDALNRIAVSVSERCSAVSCFLAAHSAIDSFDWNETTNADTPNQQNTAERMKRRLDFSIPAQLQEQISKSVPPATTAPSTHSRPPPPKLKPLITLKCFAPEGTPIQGSEYPITSDGATLGRKQGNTISFSHKIFSDQFVGIDSSISGEHATIKVNPITGQAEIYDGVKDKGSTNGTWLRLSAMHEQSEWYDLEDRMEILIGTVRFQIVVDEVVVERDLYD